MVGCDTCDDWFHFYCINLSPTQANKSDTYSCIRCALKESIVRCAQVMANMSNRWSDKGAVLRARDAQIEKTQRKLEKMEREKMVLSGSLGPVVPAAAEASTITTTTTAETPTTLTPSTTLTPEQVILQSSLATALKEIGSLQQQLAEMRKERGVEAARYREVGIFMKGVGDILWAGQPAVALTGKVAEEQEAFMQKIRLFDPFSEKGPADFGAGVRKVSEFLKTLMPEDTWSLLSPLVLPHSLQEVEDVYTLLDGFKWVNWCVCTSHVLRYPPPTPILRQLLATKLRFTDEKIIKLLNYMLCKSL
eukprot:gene45469-55643_t